MSVATDYFEEEEPDIEEIYNLAIESIDAWSKVVQEIAEEIKKCEERNQNEQIIGIIRCTNIINKHMPDVAAAD